MFLFCCLAPYYPSATSSQTPQDYPSGDAAVNHLSTGICRHPTYLSLVRVHSRHDEVALEGMGHFCELAEEKRKGSQCFWKT